MWRKCGSLRHGFGVFFWRNQKLLKKSQQNLQTKTVCEPAFFSAENCAYVKPACAHVGCNLRSDFRVRRLIIRRLQLLQHSRSRSVALLYVCTVSRVLIFRKKNQYFWKLVLLVALLYVVSNKCVKLKNCPSPYYLSSLHLFFTSSFPRPEGEEQVKKWICRFSRGNEVEVIATPSLGYHGRITSLRI